MATKIPHSLTPAPGAPEQSKAPDVDPIAQNTETILAFNSREEGNLTRAQRMLESIGSSLGRPICLGVITVFVALWIVGNMFVKIEGRIPLDVPPFPWLQGIVTLSALLTTIVVLIKQDRLAKMEERRAHLELQVNLLTEQKVSKLIKLIQELRHDLPMINDRHDAEAAAYQQPADPESVLAALDQRRDGGAI